MNIILGANGHVGSTAATILLQQDQPITVVLHSGTHAEDWQQKGAEIAICDVNDTDSLRQIFNNGERAFLLNPPAPISTDTEAIEKKSATSIVAALAGSGIRKVVAESTYGAQPGEGIGDSGVLYGMEQGLANANVSVTIIRAAYYMSNWDMSLETAQREGVVHTLYPVDFKLPMVSPEDLGYYAAKFLIESSDTTGIQYVEGPEAYSSNDVAQAFAVALNKPVKAVETPQDQWLPMLQSTGFSSVAAKSMAAVTKLTLKNMQKIASPNRGVVSLQAYIKKLVEEKQTN